MKKLMVAVAIAMLGVVANAASMTWNSASTIKLPDGTDSTGFSGVSMYLFELTPEQYAVYSALADDKVSGAVWNDYGSKLGTANTSDADWFGNIGLTDSRTFIEGNTAYAAVIFTKQGWDDTSMSPAGDITHYIGNIGEYTFTSGADGNVFDLDTTVGGMGGSTAVTWAAVPEPTSGLLLLLGVAGLALRRRRA